jgi:hypothetical protein
MALSDVSTPDVAEIAIPSPLPARTDRDGRPISNLMLLAIPDQEFAVLRPLLEQVDLPRYRVLYEQGEKIVHA